VAELFRDIRRATRSLTRNPGFSAVVVLTLALGIGGNTAILTAAHTIFFAPLPFPHSDELVRMRATTTGPTGEQNAFNLRGSEVQILEQQGDASPFASLLAIDVENRTLTGGDTAERVSVTGYHGAWNSVLGIQPVLGRWFSAEEEKRGDQSGVAVISSALWNRRFAGDRSVLGKSIPLDNRTHAIIGVMPEGFHFPYEAEVWTPTTIVAQSVDDYAVFGRLKPGVSFTAASQALVAVAKTLVQQFPNLYSVGVGLKLWPLHESFVEGQERAAVSLAAVGGFFLLLASFNVASLLLARSVTRRRELQIRAALGASRWQLIRRSLAETFVLSIAGGTIGIALAAQGTPYLDALIPTVLTRELNVTANGAGLFSFGVALALSLLTALVAGFLPAISSASIDPDGLGRENTRTSSRRERFWMDSFVVLEFTLALALIAGAGLMLHNFSLLTRRDLGIDATHLLAMHVSTTDPRYASAESKRNLVEQVVRSAESTPGVAAAGISTVNPLGGTTWTAPIAIESREITDAATSYAVNHRLITPRSFEAMGIHLLQGRSFTEQDDPSAPGVAIVSRRMARKYWANGDALGKRVRVNRPGRPWLVVVGIVSDVNDSTDRAGPRETWYLPYAQNAETPAASDVVLMVRSIADPRGIEHGVEQSVHAVNKGLALYDTSAMDRYYLDTLSHQRLGSILISLLAGFGLLLGSLGIYGTLSFTVGERVREIGIRMALGAGRLEILKLVMKQGLRLSLIAAAMGLGAAWALGRLLSSQLSEVAAGDPLTLFGATALLLVVACFAIYLPARRAAGLDPSLALRRE
jgi:putative ABC transport system permease protein